MTDERIADIRRRLIETGSPVPGLRLLEKTPKNALRVPALERLFPDARYVLLWRDPRESLASIVEAWNSGRFVTYPALEGWDGPWSLLLPPGWRSLRGAGLARIAAFQWESANRIALDDLDGLAAERWMSLGYAELCADPAAAMKRICDFAGLDFDRGVTAAVARRQAWSRYTLSPPRARKWLVHEAAIVDVLPQVTKTWRRLQV